MDDLKPKCYDEFMESILLEKKERRYDKTEEEKKSDWNDEILKGNKVEEED